MQPIIHFRKKPDILILLASFFENVVWVAFSIPSDSLLLVKYSVVYKYCTYVYVNCILEPLFVTLTKTKVEPLSIILSVNGENTIKKGVVKKYVYKLMFVKTNDR
jgi:hypothetical protein